MKKVTSPVFFFFSYFFSLMCVGVYVRVLSCNREKKDIIKPSLQVIRKKIVEKLGGKIVYNIYMI